MLLQIFYANDKVEQYFTNYGLMQKKIGKDITRAVKKRIDSLIAADNMRIYLSTGLGNPHFLSGDMKEYISISLTANYRLIILPISDSDDIVDLKVCRIIEVKGVDDYHGGKSNWLIS